MAIDQLLPVSFSFLGLDIPIHLIFLYLGFLLFTLIFIREGRRYNLPKLQCLILSVIILGVGYWTAWVFKYLYFSKGGPSLYIGLIGAVLVGALYARWQKIPLFNVGDAAAPAAALGFGVIKLGLAFSGLFMPIQFWQSLLLFVLFVFSYLTLVWSIKQPGRRLRQVMLPYAVGRLILDFWSGTHVLAKIGPLFLNQWLGIVFISIGIYLFIRRA
ncbi:MAG: prolipoprotein diacylglyceryl transferase family protein [Pseudomonadota bacterium]